MSLITPKLRLIWSNYAKMRRYKNGYNEKTW
nr:MAG TPA: hypothetical protein [Caudoviricetes sp.]